MPKTKSARLVVRAVARVSSAVVLSAVALGCATEGGPTRPEVSGSEPTYHDDVAPIIAQRCLSCHAEGGIGPVRLDGFESLKEHAELALLNVQSGNMPPWMPDPDCHRYEEERLMTAEEIDTFTAWVEGEQLEGDAPAGLEGAPKAAELDPFVPTHAFTVEEGYVPSDERPDDYRCFVLEGDFDVDTYVRGSQIVPEQGALVHHVLVYAIDPDDVERVLRGDESEAGPGYQCFGGPFPDDESEELGTPTMLAAWAPGSRPLVARNGAATRIRAGSRIVMQLHYNTVTAEPVADHTELQLDLSTEAPSMLMEARPVPVIDLAIPAGERHSEFSATYTNYSGRDLAIGIVAGHMHKLGVEIRTDIVRANEDDECLLDIPAWDFSWQQGYRIRPEENLVLRDGDGLRVTCSYDNSPRNQPIVNGQRLTPRDVSWGEGSFDEMCLSYVGFLVPYSEPVDVSGSACAAAAPCVGSTDSIMGDVLGCEDPQLSCVQCMVPGVLTCAPQCAPKLLGMRECLQKCGFGAYVFGGAAAPCLEAECGEAYDELRTCLDPLVGSDDCREAMAGCGLPTD